MSTKPAEKGPLLIYAGLLYVVSAWALNTVAVKHAVADFNPLAFTAIRFLVMPLVTLAWLRAAGVSLRFERKDLPLLLLCGACGYGVYQYLWVLGLSLTTPFASALFLSLTPVFTIIFAALLRVERVHAPRWVGAAIALIGMVIFEGAFSGTFKIRIGDLLTLLAAAIFAMYSMGTARLSTRYSALSLLGITLCLGSLMIIPGMIWSVFHQDFHRITPLDWGIFAYAVIFPIMLTYPVWTAGITRLGVARTALFQFGVPILTTVFSLLLLHLRIASYQIAGGIVCIAGVAIAQVFGHISMSELWAQRTLPAER